MKKNNIPMRRCAACMESKPKSELIRIACYEGRLTVAHPGREAETRALPKTRRVERAKKRKVIQRNFEADIPQSEIEKNL